MILELHCDMNILLGGGTTYKEGGTTYKEGYKVQSKRISEL